MTLGVVPDMNAANQKKPNMDHAIKMLYLPETANRIHSLIDASKCVQFSVYPREGCTTIEQLLK